MRFTGIENPPVAREPSKTLIELFAFDWKGREGDIAPQLGIGIVVQSIVLPGIAGLGISRHLRWPKRYLARAPGLTLPPRNDGNM
jgi:hypothetical protein